MLRALLIACLILSLFSSTILLAQDDAKCFGCHGKTEFARKTSTQGKSLFVDKKDFTSSTHAENGCVSCHSDIDKLPHNAKLKPVSCSECHEDQQKIYDKSVHGKGRAKGDKDAASCGDCHTYHSVKPAKDPASSTYQLNLPKTCGKCHANTDMAARHQIPVPDAFQQYVDSVHGKALLKGGLLFSASCTDCHGGHDILPEKDPSSRISTKNIPNTCGKCHVGVLAEYKNSSHGMQWVKGSASAATCKDCHVTHEIKNTDSSKFQLSTIMECGNCHKKLLETYQQTEHGKLIAKGVISSAKCSDCHGSHSILPPSSPSSMLSSQNRLATCRKCHRDIDEKFTKFDPHVASRNTECLGCHSNKNLKMNRDGKEVSLFVDGSLFSESVHSQNGCIACHPGVNKFPHEKRPEPLSCGTCHTKIDSEYRTSVHSTSRSKGDTDAASCDDCHGMHYIKPVKSPESQVYPLSLPETCGKCHGSQKFVEKHDMNVPEAFQKYVDSVHGEGLLKSGLLVSAACNDCHGAHNVKSNNDPLSMVYSTQIPDTCGKCHEGIKDQYQKSVHGQLWINGDSRAPVCTNCHPTHQISSTETRKFQLEDIEECGSCHKEALKTYRHSYHGKVTALKYTTIAKCHDCHDTHLILPISDPQSPVSKENRINVCRKCHKNAPPGMASFGAHANPRNKAEFPALYYTWLSMTALLVSVFSFFGIHTILWFIRGIIDKKKHPHDSGGSEKKDTIYYQRVDPLHRVLHLFVIISFFGLALTGLPLKFSDMRWSEFLANLVGGYESARIIHRICVVITFGYFVIHIGFLIKSFAKRIKSTSFLKVVFGPDSPAPNLQDFKDFYHHVRWFFGLGPRPTFDRWTYWEKFDYMAVFWGVAVIGGSGLVLWFPHVASNIFPGWLINIALVVHSDEALLAMGFIFTVHFFNTHLRPEKFPLDYVIFTGRISGEEMENERGKFKERMEASGEIETIKQSPPSSTLLLYARIFAVVMVTIGIILVTLIIISALKK